MAKTMMAEASHEADLSASSAVSDLHVFDFPETVSIRAKEKRQLALLTASAMKVEKQYRLDGSNSHYGNLKHGIQRENKADPGLAMPSGTDRPYIPYNGGDLLHGEDKIRHASVGERLTPTIGLAADNTNERRQTNFRRGRLLKNVIETANRIILCNSEAVTVDLILHIPGDWRMLEESQPRRKRTSAQSEWMIRYRLAAKRN